MPASQAVGRKHASPAGVPVGRLLHGGPAHFTLPLNQNWRFGEKLHDSTLQPDFDDRGLSEITLPHCVTRLSWQKWDPASWQRVWIYRRPFTLPRELKDLRLFLHFDDVMIAATPVVNGHALPQHLGGFLPFRYEVTDLVREKENLLAVAVDSRWSNVPPEGSPKGPASIDYLLPGGITGSVYMHAVPQCFIDDVFAKPVKVLDLDRQLHIACTLDIGAVPSDPLRLAATLFDGTRIVASASQHVEINKSGQIDVSLMLGGLQNITLWEVGSPRLYDLVVTLLLKDKPLHDYRVRVGFREARFEVDGFFLNGRRLQLFGLNRHELYPYVGRAMPNRVLRRDAEILKRDFNCNVARCSHYPQSEAFLDACDELGLMIWEEIPGWQYIGDQSWQDLAVRDVQDMVCRDRNHPCVIIWGVRINESHNDPALYQRTKQAAKSLDDTRPTSGTMVYYSTRDWVQDVFAYDDYHAAPDGSVGLKEPLPGVPFFFSEAVGQFEYDTGRGFHRTYRRTGDPRVLQQQALLHAQVHDRGATNPHCAGVIAWCAFDYGSLVNSYAGVKYPGIADVFRIPKLGASFYLAQVDPKVRPVIEPNFYWDFGPRTPSGPGERAAIFSNCDRLELHIDGKPHSVLHPDRTGFPHLRYPPFFADLRMEGSRNPELRIDGYVGSNLALSRSLSADRTADQLFLQADDNELLADGSDCTRVAFGAADKFGAPRPFVEGEVRFSIEGPGIIVGDNPFQLADSGGLGAIWIRATRARGGSIRLAATHAGLGTKSIVFELLQSSLRKPKASPACAR